MLTWIRRHVSLEDGVSVVETLFAVLVLTVALFGLMGTFIASAASQLDQRSRTSATRVATHKLEVLRRTGFEALKAQLPVGANALTITDPPVSVNGQSYTVTTLLQELDANDSSLGPQPGQPTVMHATATTEWSVKDKLKSVKFSTAVAPTKPDAAKDIKKITLFPNPSILNPPETDPGASVNPTRDVTITVELKGLDSSTPVSVTYDDDASGVKGPHSLLTADGKSWTLNIARTQIVESIPVGDQSGELPFTVRVDIGNGMVLTQNQTLMLVRASTPPEIAKIDLTPQDVTDNAWEADVIVSINPITVYKQGNKFTKGYNTAAVRFSVRVWNFEAPPLTGDAVTLYIPDVSGSYVARSLAYDGVSDRWWIEFPAKGQTFKEGKPTTFYLTAYRAVDGLWARSWLASPYEKYHPFTHDVVGV